jgi:hypothetical protein
MCYNMLWEPKAAKLSIGTKIASHIDINNSLIVHKWPRVYVFIKVPITQPCFWQKIAKR